MRSLLIKGVVLDKKELKMDLLETIGMLKKREKPKPKLTFFQIWDKIASERATGKELYKGKRFSDNTMTNYNVTKNVLRYYMERRPKNKIDLDTFTLDDFKRLESYLVTEAGFSMNSVSAHVMIFKSFFAAAHARGLHNNTIYLNAKFRVTIEEAANTYITMEELNALDKLEFWGNQAKARDFIMIGAFTGLRISDMRRLKSHNIINNTVTILSKKTKEPVVIPIHPYLRNLLARNNGKWPASCDITVLNANIKKMAKNSGLFNDAFLWKETRNGITTEKHSPRYAMLSTHSGRRSFISNTLQNGISLTDVMKLAGIRNEKTIHHYNKITAQQVAVRIAKHPFFNT